MALILFGAAAPASAKRPDLLWMRGGHAGYDTYSRICAAFSPGGNQLATADCKDVFSDATAPMNVKLWSVPEGKLTGTLQLPTTSSTLSSIAFSPDGQRLGTSLNVSTFGYGQDTTPHPNLLVYQLSDGELLKSLALPYPMLRGDPYLGETPFSFSPDGQTLMAATDGRHLLVRVRDGAILREYQNVRGNAVFSPDGQSLAIMDHYAGPSPIRIYRVSDNALLGTVTPEAGAEDRVTFQYNPDGQSLSVIALGNSGVATLSRYRIDDGGLIRRMEFRANGHPFLVRLSRDRQLLASSYSKDSALVVGVWDTSTGAHLRDLDRAGDFSQHFLNLEFSPDNQVLLVQRREGDLRLWRVGDGQPYPMPDFFEFHPGENVLALAFSSEGALNVVKEKAVVAYGAEDGQKRSSFPIEAVRLLSAAYSAARDLLVTGYGATTHRYTDKSGSSTGVSGQNSVVIQRADDGQTLRTLTGHTGNVLSVAISPDNRTVASGSGIQPRRDCVRMFGCGTSVEGTDYTVRLWRVEDGQPLHTLTGHEDEVTAVAFSPDGETLASGDKTGVVRLWRVSDGASLRTLAGASTAIHSLRFSPDGLALTALADGNIVPTWSVGDGRLLRSLDLPGDRAVFSPDGTLLAVTDGVTLQIRRASDGALLDGYADETRGITQIAFSEDNRLLSFYRSDGVLATMRNAALSLVRLGDVTADETVDVGDVVLTLGFVVGLHEPSEVQQRTADVSLDGRITVEDAVRILQFIVGLRTDAGGG